MVLETKRLILRPWEESDAGELYRYASDPRIGLSAGFPPHTSVEDSRRVIREVLSEPETYAVILRDTGLPVGSAGIMKARCPQARENELEIGYWIGVPYWGRGLIPEAVRRLQRRCFLELGCAGIWCGYYEGNEKSRRVQEKCGFTYRYTQKDHVCSLIDRVCDEHFTYITREEWERADALERFWQRFLAVSGRGDGTRYSEAFHFETNRRDADKLLGLVLSGKKRATSSALPCYELEGEDIPKAGELSIVTDFAGKPYCVIETTRVTVIPFSRMTFDICSREGEDDTLASWQEKHRRFFSCDAREYGYEFNEDMPVVFEDFEVLYQENWTAETTDDF